MKGPQSTPRDFRTLNHLSAPSTSPDSPLTLAEVAAAAGGYPTVPPAATAVVGNQVGEPMDTDGCVFFLPPLHHHRSISSRNLFPSLFLLLFPLPAAAEHEQE